MKYKVSFIILFFALSSCTTYKYSKEEVLEKENRIKTYIQKRKEQTKTITDKINRINELYKEQPLKYSDLKKRSDALQKNVNDLNSCIDSLKKETEHKSSDEDKYTFMCNTVFYNKILFNESNLSDRSIELKNKIDKFYNDNQELFKLYRETHSYNSRFNTNDPLSDREGNKVDYMNFFLLDKPVIDILEYLENLQLEINTFQYSAMNSMIAY